FVIALTDRCEPITAELTANHPVDSARGMVAALRNHARRCTGHAQDAIHTCRFVRGERRWICELQPVPDMLIGHAGQPRHDAFARALCRERRARAAAPGYLVLPPGQHTRPLLIAVPDCLVSGGASLQVAIVEQHAGGVELDAGDTAELRTANVHAPARHI